MELELSTTPRETWVWTRDDGQKSEIEALLRDADRVVLEATEPQLEPRAINIEIGAPAMDSLQTLQDAGYSFRWHSSQHFLNRGSGLYGAHVNASDTLT